jgi:hypothetical protein
VFTRPDRPYTRRAFSDEDRAARRWLAGRMAEAGLVPAVDAAGNQIGRSAGPGPGPALVIGSHLDTVEAGGRFAGIAFEVANFTCEGPSDFGLSTIGSRAMSGKLDAARRAPGDVLRYLELHIEQAVSLDRAGLSLGVVTVIAAPSRYRVAIRGRRLRPLAAAHERGQPRREPHGAPLPDRAPLHPVPRWPQPLPGGVGTRWATSQRARGSSWRPSSASTVISPDRARRGCTPVASRRLRGAPGAPRRA